MADDTFSWSNLGGGSSHLVKISERIQFLSSQQTDILNAIIDIHKVIGELRSEVNVMNSNFLTDYRRMGSGNYDDKSVTSFLSLDDLNIEAPSRPVEDSLDEDDSIVIAEEMIIVNEGFTAPVPERNENKESYEGMTDEDIVVKILDDLKTYLSEHTAVMNYSLRKKGIIPDEYEMPASVKKLLKTAVNLDDSEVQLYKLDKMRGMYHFNGVENPQELYDEIFT
ncbi:MAG: hypothetical protein BEU00_03475 [Marine Group III euryarchaeote CG-Epi3]|uniref:Uncharacterized protein n=1 Tax=Marine Group III euryarchaeote CG-Epi3 TaxID=1888997 RepID=A0A1J5U4D2_9ARCH|nr:MAG: hypothetical protein BEU00_03475 [Marine Group III euryarchaeote CG-Epi3]|tara:strand:+ start:1647 stop:2318 length:672 start_codon:yes stop_codon:yes gene_type:complete